MVSKQTQTSGKVTKTTTTVYISNEDELLWLSGFCHIVGQSCGRPFATRLPQKKT